MQISEEDQIFLDQHHFVLYHVGIENQNAYTYAEQGFEYELVCHPKGGWAYHIERHKVMKFDSRLGAKTYKTAEEAYNRAKLSVHEYAIRGFKVNNIINCTNRPTRGINKPKIKN